MLGFLPCPQNAACHAVDGNRTRRYRARLRVDRQLDRCGGAGSETPPPEAGHPLPATGKVKLIHCRISSQEDRDVYLDTPAWRRLVGLLTKLSYDERIDLMALGWLGRESGSWASLLEHAYESGIDDAHYVAGLGLYWQKGIDRLRKAQQA